MTRMIRIMMILRIRRIMLLKNMIEITRSSTSTRTGAIINVTIAFQ